MISGSIAIFLGVVVGIILFFGIIVFVLWHKFKKAAKRNGLGDITVNSFIDDCERAKMEKLKRPKNIYNMTSSLTPLITKDFDDLNVQLLFNKAEKGLRAVFESINDGYVHGLDEFPLLEEKVKYIIKNNQKNNIKINYSDIVFHKFAIADYRKYNGVATISVSTAVEYFYRTDIEGKINYNSKYKEQASYTCNFIYIYAESDLEESVFEKVIGLNCPNCGAALSSFRNPVCKYCGTCVHIDKRVEENAKAWAFSSYTEN